MGTATENANNKKIFLFIIAIIFSGIIVSFFAISFFHLNKDSIYHGIYIAGVDVSDLTKMEARNKLEDIYEIKIDSLSFDLNYKDYNKKISYRDLDYEYLYDESIEKAYDIGREGNIFRRVKEVYQLKNNPVDIDLDTKYNDDVFDEIIMDVKENINKKSQDASIKRENGVFNITEEVTGIEVKEEVLKDLIHDNIKNFSTETIDIPVDTIEPRIKAEALRNIKDVIGEFSTVFNTQAVGRTKNIRIASNSITHTLLMPGEEFSFNEKTGPRGVAEGYQEAPVIINGELVPGIGGGICQVSTTLYNAVVRANLEISNRRNHSIPVGYVPLGHDATVSYNHIDFKFKNNRKHPIYLESFVKGNRIYIRFYGVKENDPIIGLHSVVTEAIEPKMEVKKDGTLPIGETKVEIQGKQGYRVNTYKIYYQDGREIKRELISKDYYAPTNGLILEGTRGKSLEELEKETKENMENEIGSEEYSDDIIQTEETIAN
ncbi:MAG: hypothetical protein GX214_06055 [Clostridiales bacterium]|nr:hypothetical protein [Clostridiales bacterium]